MVECQDCRYFEPIVETVEGYCHRYPATVRKGVRDWCGEFVAAHRYDVAKAARDEWEFYERFRREDGE